MGDCGYLLGGLLYGGDDLLSGRVDDLEGTTVNTVDPLVVDEPMIKHLVPNSIMHQSSTIDRERRRSLQSKRLLVFDAIRQLDGLCKAHD